MPEFLTDDEAALIWAGDTSSLANLETKQDEQTQQTSAEEEATRLAAEAEKAKGGVIINEDDLNNAFSDDSSNEDDDDDEGNNDPEVKEEKKNDPPEEQKKPGRKPSDLVSIVSQLIDEEVLKPFEDSEIKTIEDAKELIKLNLQSKEEESETKWWESKVNAYSPQVQAILHYAEKGGTDIGPLLNAISQVEDTATLSLDTESDQEEVVRQTLKVKGFDDEEIADQISTLKDLDKLKAKAEKFFPELRNMKQQQYQMLMQEQEQREAQARDASTKYLTTVQNTLNKETVKGIKLQKDDKFKIYDALAAPKYTSLSGSRTNGFVKALEELQFGEHADYEQFLNIVHFTVDPEGFVAKLKESLKSEVASETAKKLRASKTTTPNSEETYESRQTKKNTVSRSTFKNPFG